MTPEEAAARDLVQLGMENEYHCIFVGPYPMYHGLSRERVAAHYELVIPHVAKALKTFKQATP